MADGSDRYEVVARILSHFQPQPEPQSDDASSYLAAELYVDCRLYIECRHRDTLHTTYTYILDLIVIMEILQVRNITNKAPRFSISPGYFSPMKYK